MTPQMLAGLLSAHGQGNPVVTGRAAASVSETLRPLELLDLPEIYGQHAALIDFLLFFLLFNGLAQATLTGHLKGKGGRLTSAAIGSSLALALSGLSWATGFSVLSLGPVAVMILLGLVGTVIFRVLRRLQVSKATAGALVLVLVSFSLEAAAPTLAESIAEVFPFLDLAVALGLLLLIWRAARHLMPKGSKAKADELADKVEKGDGPGRSRAEPGGSVRGETRASHLKKELRREKPEIGRKLKGVVSREGKESRSILRELHLIRGVLQDGRHPAKDRRAIAEALRRIPPKRHRIRVLVEEVKDLDRRLARFDLGVLHELREAFGKVSPGEQKLMRKLVLEERQKIKSEQRIAIVEDFVKTYDVNSAKCIETAAVSIVKNEIPAALKWVDAAVGYEEEARRMIKRAQAVQSMLKRITRLELRQLRKAA
jgi:hypothetical protein